MRSHPERTRGDSLCSVSAVLSEYCARR